MTTDTEVREEVKPQSIYTLEQWLELEDLFKRSLKCSVLRYTCYSCGHKIRPCDNDATVLVIKVCGCRMPVCKSHADKYVAHFNNCVRKRGIPESWRCAWCHKYCNPSGFRYEDI